MIYEKTNYKPEISNSVLILNTSASKDKLKEKQKKPNNLFIITRRKYIMLYKITLPPIFKLHLDSYKLFLLSIMSSIEPPIRSKE